MIKGRYPLFKWLMEVNIAVDLEVKQDSLMDGDSGDVDGLGDALLLQQLAEKNSSSGRHDSHLCLFGKLDHFGRIRLFFEEIYGDRTV